MPENLVSRDGFSHSGISFVFWGVLVCFMCDQACFRDKSGKAPVNIWYKAITCFRYYIYFGRATCQVPQTLHLIIVSQDSCCPLLRNKKQKKGLQFCKCHSQRRPVHRDRPAHSQLHGAASESIPANCMTDHALSSSSKPGCYERRFSRH